MTADEEFERALALHRQGKVGEAEPIYRAILERDPNHFAALRHLGVIAMSAARLEPAVALLTRAIAANPGSAVAHNDLGIALAHLARHKEAVTHFRRAVELDPAFTLAHTNLGGTLAAMGEYKDAMASYNRAIALAPKSADTYGSLGNALKTLGRIDESRSAFEKAIKFAPRRGRLYHNLSEVKRFTVGDPVLRKLDSMVNDPLRRGDELMFVHFAYGSALADIGEYDEAFHQLAEGNRLKRARVAYDEAAVLGVLTRVAQVFTADFIRARAGQGDPSPTPVFVIGMPRSGSSLVEQILASHPRVFGTGESTVFNDAVRAVLPKGARFPEYIASISGEELRLIGGRHVAAMSALAPKADRAVDKTLGNFAYAGMIHLALPNARIVHVSRNPADTCVSCFSKLFASEFRYTYDLGELGRYYRSYAALMEHWRRVLPPGVMLDVKYEDVVADLEPHARRVIDHCGLEWDNACLRFHDTERAVRTYSATQVRQPIYKGAIDRWRVYEQHLGPLVRELDTVRH